MELRLEDGFHRGEDHRKIFRQATGHDGVRRHLLHGNGALERLHDAKDEILAHRSGGEHFLHERLGRRDDGQAVGPSAVLQVTLGAGEIGRHFEAPRGNGRNRAHGLARPCATDSTI